jgi:hypothetical protein
MCAGIYIFIFVSFGLVKAEALQNREHLSVFILDRDLKLKLGVLGASVGHRPYRVNLAALRRPDLPTIVTLDLDDIIEFLTGVDDFVERHKKLLGLELRPRGLLLKFEETVAVEEIVPLGIWVRNAHSVEEERSEIWAKRIVHNLVDHSNLALRRRREISGSNNTNFVSNFELRLSTLIHWRLLR